MTNEELIAIAQSLNVNLEMLTTTARIYAKGEFTEMWKKERLDLLPKYD